MNERTVVLLASATMFSLIAGMWLGQLVTITQVQVSCQHEGRFKYVSRLLTGPVIVECREMKK